MNLFPRMTETELDRARECAKKHVDSCTVCRIRRGSPGHTTRLLAELRKVLREHVKRCHTCRTRGEAAQLAHYKAILQEYIAGGAVL